MPTSGTKLRTGVHPWAQVWAQALGPGVVRERAKGEKRGHAQAWVTQVEGGGGEGVGGDRRWVLPANQALDVGIQLQLVLVQVGVQVVRA
jgi:hypothetical protein